MRSFNVGIAGGKDFSALYFVGLSDSDHLLYLDPHYVQESIPLSEIFDYESMFERAQTEFHCNKMKTLKLSKMCTSVAIGFYIRDGQQFLDFKAKLLKLSRDENSIFSVYENKP